MDNMSNKNNQLDSLAMLLQELIEKYADQIDFEKLQLDPKTGDSKENNEKEKSTD